VLNRFVPGRSDFAALAEYLAGAAARAGVAIQLGIDADAASVLRLNPDIVVIATGAAPGMPCIPGIDDAPIVDAFSVIRKAAPVRRALVLGGGMLGVAVAHVLAERGAEVIVAEPGSELSGELGLRPRWQYVANLRARENVTIHLNTSVEALGDDRALLRHEARDVELQGLDIIVPARPMLSHTTIGDALRALADGPPVFDIGDCVLPRTAFEAMQDGAALGHRV
jgi:NADPH-dependent 2,4-dienoyl-CoA reductase/sulfur reductase-like enzyme